MSFRINSNIESLNAQRNLSKVGQSLSQSFERLSSGLRINSARDDAAGLAITDRFSAQVKSLNQAVRNANDGISLSQVAESAMSEETNILLRMRELAVQSANDTNTIADRTSIQAEVEQLSSELNRIGNNSQFNNQNILDGTFGTAYIHVGAMANQTISISLTDSRATALGATASASPAASVDAVAMAVGDVTINGVSIDASVATDDTKSSTGNSYSAIAKAAAINKSLGAHGVTASVVASTVTGGAVVGGALATGELTINGVNIDPVAVVAAGDSDGKLTAAINAKTAATGVTASVTAGAIVLTAADARNIDVAGTSAAVTGLATATTTGGLRLSGDRFTMAGANVAARTGVTAQTYEVDFTSVVSKISMTTRAGANAALGVLDIAINQVASRRGNLGAVQNRLTATVSNLEAVSQNLSAASSRIKDADFAQETAEMTRSQILQNAGVSMLAQANSAPQSVLTLLR